MPPIICAGEAKENIKCKGHIQILSCQIIYNNCFFGKSVRVQLQLLYCLLSGVTSVDFVKFGVVRLKTLLLSPPTTTWAPSKGTNTARLCNVMATRESLVSLIPNKTCNHENGKYRIR